MATRTWPASAGFGVGDVRGPPVDAGQRSRPVPRHRPDSQAQPGQVRGECRADLAGPEHHVQSILSHDQILAGPGSLAAGDGRAPVPAADATPVPKN
jgi:hypothetical protein